MKFKHLLLIILVLSTLVLLFSCGETPNQEVKEYTVTFDSNGGTSVEAQVVEENKRASAPNDPTKEGYTFLGWYVGDEKWSFISHTVTENITLKAKWEIKSYTVTFDAKGGEGGKTVTVEHGGTLLAPMPTRANYSFEGWYFADTKWSFKTDTVTSDITLVAKWEPFTKTITFNANGGTVSEKTRKVKYNEAIGTLPVPVYENHEFLGWYISGDMENQITEDYIVTDKITLVAKWGNPPCSVTFNANGGTVCEGSRKVREGEMIGILPTPERDGYKFAGWFLEGDVSFDDKISQRDIVMFDIVLVAKWERDENAMLVTFDPNGGTIAEADAVKYVQKGKYIGNLPTPTRDGYTFLGWFLSDGTEIKKTTTINTNTICIALWIEKIYCTDGTENHAWSMWTELFTPTCETPQIDARECVICGCVELRDGTPALGHDWSDWSEEYMSRSRKCYECQKEENQQLKNVTNEGITSFNQIKVEGNAWNAGNGSTLINGMFELDNTGLISGKGTSPLTVTLELSSPAVLDMIYVKGKGTATIEVTVTCEDGTEVSLGVGAFGDEPSVFDVGGRVITKVVVYMPNPSEGSDIWQEITLARKI